MTTTQAWPGRAERDRRQRAGEARVSMAMSGTCLWTRPRYRFAHPAGRYSPCSSLVLLIYSVIHKQDAVANRAIPANVAGIETLTTSAARSGQGKRGHETC